MTAGGNMAAFGALLMITTMRPATLPLIVWFAVIAALGVFAVIPIKRQLINKEGLAFPTGTATAAIIRNIHGDDKKADLATASQGFSAVDSDLRDELSVDLRIGYLREKLGRASARVVVTSSVMLSTAYTRHRRSSCITVLPFLSSAFLLPARHALSHECHATRSTPPRRWHFPPPLPRP